MGWAFSQGGLCVYGLGGEFLTRNKKQSPWREKVDSSKDLLAARDEKQTRIELINPVLFERGWGENLIREERMPGGADIIDGKPRKRRGRTDG